MVAIRRARYLLHMPRGFNYGLQGFPDWYKIIVSDAQAKKQAGNAVPVNMIKAVAQKLLPYIATTIDPAMVLREYDLKYNAS